MPDVFLLGAGFSKAISAEMPVLDELSADLLTRIKLSESITRAGDNVEHWMTYLAQPQPWVTEAGNLRNKADFLELTKEIGQLLVDRTQNVVRGPCPTWLAELVCWWHEN